MKAARRHFLASWGHACWPARSWGLAVASILSSGGRGAAVAETAAGPCIPPPGHWLHEHCQADAWVSTSARVPDLGKSSGAPSPSPPDMGGRGSREGSLGLQPEAPPLGAQQEHPVPKANPPSASVIQRGVSFLPRAPSDKGSEQTGHALRCQILLAHEIVLLLREA